ncbi:hypothetical protein [Lipingzhangella rawalii]|nr:hypothetical protein [Lipingzhangella rawalii]
MEESHSPGSDGATERGPTFDVLCDSEIISSDTAEGILENIIGGYVSLATESARVRARTEYAVHAQQTAQPLLNAGEQFDLVTPHEAEILLASQAVPPHVAQWSCPIPLILVSTYYEPLGVYARPVVEPPGQVWWIDPSTPRSLLVTLHGLRWLDLRAADAAMTDASRYCQPSGTNGSAGYFWRSYP